MSISTRFPFFLPRFRFSDFDRVPGSERFNSFPYNILYWFMTNLQIWRWRHRCYGLPLELWLMERLLTKTRGFV